MLFEKDEYHEDYELIEGHFDEEDKKENDKINHMINDEREFYDDQLINSGHIDIDDEYTEKCAFDRLRMEKNRFNIMIYKDSGLGVYNTIKCTRICTKEEKDAKLHANHTIWCCNKDKKLLYKKIKKYINDKRKYPDLYCVYDKLFNYYHSHKDFFDLPWEFIQQYFNDELGGLYDNNELYSKFFVL